MYILFGKSYVAAIINHEIPKDKAKMSKTNEAEMEITTSEEFLEPNELL